MKNNKTKNSFGKFSKRGARKEKQRNKAKAELLRAVMETGVGTRALKLRYSVDKGRGARISSKQRRDEICTRGVFSSSKSGFGFVASEDGYSRDIFIPEDKTAGAIDGDFVEISYHVYKSRFGEEKTEGRVRKIVEYGRKTVIGTVRFDSSFRGNKRHSSARLIVVPDDSKILLRPIISGGLEVNEGDKVEALLNRSLNTPIECTVTKNFGNSYTKSANYEAIIAECEIPVEFTPAQIMEADFFASMPISDEGRVRRDRDVIFTVDGAGAKDLDDAVSLKRLKGGLWQLGVHIADVSHYVRERTHLDRAVMSRGTSVYFADKVVPMLPPSLSNGACSLNSGEDKYALSAIINLSPTGEIISTKIEPSIIRSRLRGVYDEVNEIFEGTATAQIKQKYKEVLPTLTKMRELYQVLKRKSKKRGAIELETAEAEILLDSDGVPQKIVKRERGDAEKMIEQFMLCANEAVANLLSEKGIPCVFRIHENPPPEKLDEFITFAHNLGFDTSSISREKTTPSDFSALLTAAAERGILTPVSYTMLRSMSKAKYSEIKHSHFGLGIDCYCHFTSPIRRLSDLATHRIIHKVLLEGKRPAVYSPYAKRAAAAATEAELRALSCERRIENLYKTIYMEGFIGEEFCAMISSVASFGFFVELDNTCEGLVPISALPASFIFDEKNLHLRSRDVVYRLGDTVKVRLEEADITRGKLRFSIID